MTITRPSCQTAFALKLQVHEAVGRIGILIPFYTAEQTLGWKRSKYVMYLSAVSAGIIEGISMVDLNKTLGVTGFLLLTI